MKAADVMTTPIVGIGPDAPLLQAVRLMIENRISGLPVLDDAGRPLGILTEGDLLQRAETGTAAEYAGWFGVFFRPGQLAGDYVRTHGRHVQDIMTPEVVTVTEDMPLADVVDIMRRQRIKRLPVVRDGIAIGVVSRFDLIRTLAKQLDRPASTEDDESLRSQIIKELSAQPWAPRRSISVAVENGVAEIDGVVFDVRARDAVRVLVENVPGVKSVENRLVCVEPNTGILIADGDEPA